MFNLRQWFNSGVMVDTARQEELQAENTRLRAALDHLSEGIFIVTPQGIVAFWSKGAGRIGRQSASGAKSRRFEDVLAVEKGKEALRKQFWQAVEQRRAVEEEFQVHGHPVRLTLTPLQDEENHTIGLVGELKDLAEEKRVEAMKVDFVNIVSHELRTPISAIKGYLDVVLKEGDYLTPEHREYLTRAFASNERQLETVESLLNVSRIEHGTIQIDLEPVRIEEVIGEVLENFRETARDKGIELKFIYPRFELPTVEADPQRLHDVLTNLVSNAVKYTHKGKVTVRVTRENGQAWVEVEDTGVGIPEDKREHLFEKFVRGERSLTEESPGTGLGLYIVKSFVELMGGEVTFESIPDHGTTFKFSLPVAQ